MILYFFELVTISVHLYDFIHSTVFNRILTDTDKNSKTQDLTVLQ